MKKLLLILLCLPMIGFGQDDKLILSSGDTIIGKAIEVGVNDITYQHKGETTNNVIKKRELAKVIYSSGRIETFKGLGILEAKIEKEENDKLYLQQKEERKKIRMQKKVDFKKLLIQKRVDFKKSLEIGALFGASFNNNTNTIGPIWGREPDDEEKYITTIQGLIFKYNYSPHFSINTELNYHISGWNRNNNTTVDNPEGSDDPFLSGDNYYNYSNHYLSLPINIEYNFYYKPSFTVKTGIYSAYLIKSILTRTLMGEEQFNLENELKEINRFDFGGILGIGLSYPINDKLTAFFDCTAYYGVTDFWNEEYMKLFEENFGVDVNRISKNRMFRTVLGLTYKL